jgi:hypothetical protein
MWFDYSSLKFWKERKMKSVLDLAEKPDLIEFEIVDYNFESQMRPGHIVSQTWMTKPTRVNNQPVDEQTTSD